MLIFNEWMNECFISLKKINTFINIIQSNHFKETSLNKVLTFFPLSSRSFQEFIICNEYCVPFDMNNIWIFIVTLKLKQVIFVLSRVPLKMSKDS